MRLSKRMRQCFDRQLERVLAEMPPLVHQLLEKVPLHVEDHPPREVLQEKGLTEPDQLCGLFAGIPLSEHSVAHPWRLPEVVTIYRLGILAAARDRLGRTSARRLRREIRITLLHELAHYHGLTEEQLEELGYG